MIRRRSNSSPKLGVAQRDDILTSMASHHLSPSTHSLNSSSASTTSSPITPTFSIRGHNRYPSSNSSVATTSDSPVTAPKSTLDDLPEDPAERDEFNLSLDEPEIYHDEPLCICDSPFCEHRRNFVLPSESLTQSTPPEWFPGDEFLHDDCFVDDWPPQRRRSGDGAMDDLTSRLSRHFTFLTRRKSHHQSNVSRSGSSVRSAPHSRSSSLRPPPIRRSVVAKLGLDFRHSAAPGGSSNTTRAEHHVPHSPQTASTIPSSPTEIPLSSLDQDPIDRQALSRTPLLPPMPPDRVDHAMEDVHSPLQSPTVVPFNPEAVPNCNTPNSILTNPGTYSPPLSSKPSMTSINMNRIGFGLHSEIPPLQITPDSDPWAIKLGHANFHITPEPYFPEVCDAQTCKRLRDDWETARLKYMCQVARISEHYGPTSQTYKFTEEKWAEIDAQWRVNHERAVNAQAGSSDSGDSPRLFQPLAETKPLSQMPALTDPQQPSKFLTVDEADIVGPMVQYAKIPNTTTRSSSKKPAFLRIFTDPVSLLGNYRANNPGQRR